jgi:AcrR family transcriptional regulator
MEVSEGVVQSQRRRGGRPDRAEAGSLRKAMLDSAEAVFLAEGFNGAKMETIAAAAGTTKQTLYARFGSKAALFVEVSNRLLAGRFTPTRARSASLRDALVDVSEQALSAMLDPKLVRMHCIITAEAARFPELARLTDEDEHFPGRTILSAILADAAQSGEIICGDVRQSMLMLQDMVLSGPLRAASLGLASFGPEERRARAEYAVDMFLNGALPRTG